MFTAVQHERAPRTCIIPPPHHLSGMTPAELYSSAKRLQPHFTSACNFYHLPMPQNTPKLIPNFRYNIPSIPFHYSLAPANLTSEMFLDHPPPKLPQSFMLKEDEVTSTEVTSSAGGSSPAFNPHSSSLLRQEAVYESAAKLLFLAVRWARSIQSFLQLPIHDQRKLLENSWSQLFVITASQWGLNLDILAADKNLSLLNATITKFKMMRVDQTEAACLKALLLFEPDCQEIISVAQIASLQEQTLGLLYEKCASISRYGHVLMIIPQIKSSGNPKSLQELLFKGTVGEVAIERILGDLISNAE